MTFHVLTNDSTLGIGTYLVENLKRCYNDPWGALEVLGDERTD